MNRTLAITSLLSFFLCPVPALCAGSGLAPLLKGMNAVEVPTVVSRDSSAAPKEWTVMIFMNGKNNLGNAALEDLNEMELAGSTDKVNVVVELGRISESRKKSKTTQSRTLSKEDLWTGIRRYYITRDFFVKPGQTEVDALREAVSRINSPVVGTAKDEDMGAYTTVVDFARWTKQNYPARKYMLILWNHGSGWADPKPGAFRGISFDDKTSNYIRTGQLAPMLKAMGGIDVLAMDACLMQQIEIAYEVRRDADMLVASEDVEPEYGYDYAALIGRLAAAPGSGSEAAAEIIADTYVDFYAKYEQQLHKYGIQSVISLKQIDPLVSALNDWVAVALRTSDTDALDRASDNVIRFNQLDALDPEMTVTTYADLYHFIELAGQYSSDANLAAASAAFKKAIKTAVIHNRTIGKNIIDREYSLARGIGINLPRVSSDPADTVYDGKMEKIYSETAFAKNSDWGKFFTFLKNIKNGRN